MPTTKIYKVKKNMIALSIIMPGSLGLLHILPFIAHRGCETERPTNSKLRQRCSMKILPQKGRFVDIFRIMGPSELSLSYSIIDSSGNKRLSVRIFGFIPISVNIVPLFPEVSEKEVRESEKTLMLSLISLSTG